MCTFTCIFFLENSDCIAMCLNYFCITIPMFWPSEGELLPWYLRVILWNAACCSIWFCQFWGKKTSKAEQNPICAVLKQLGVINMQVLSRDKNSSPILPLVVNLEEYEKKYIYTHTNTCIYMCICIYKVLSILAGKKLVLKKNNLKLLKTFWSACCKLSQDM